MFEIIHSWSRNSWWIHHKARFSWGSETRDREECTLLLLLSKILICYIQDFSCRLRSEELTSGAKVVLQFLPFLRSYMATDSDLCIWGWKTARCPSFIWNRTSNKWTGRKLIISENFGGQSASLLINTSAIGWYWLQTTLYIYKFEAPYDFTYRVPWLYQTRQRDLSFEDTIFARKAIYLNKSTYICTYKNSLHLEQDSTYRGVNGPVGGMLKLPLQRILIYIQAQDTMATHFKIIPHVASPVQGSYFLI